MQWGFFKKLSLALCIVIGDLSRPKTTTKTMRSQMRRITYLFSVGLSCEQICRSWILSVASLQYYTNKISDENLQQFLQPREQPARSYNVTNNKCLENVLIISVIIARKTKCTRLSRKIFLSFTINGCSFLKLHCYECVI